MHTGRMPCEQKGTNWGHASSSQETPTVTGKPPKAQERGREQIPPPYRSQKEQTLPILGFQIFSPQNCETTADVI